MGLSWTLVFTILVIGFIVIPGAVFFSHLNRIRKEKTD